jgi:small subunit ribosomal protein S6
LYWNDGKHIQNQFFQPIFASKGFQAKINRSACAIFGLFPLPLQPQICIGRFSGLTVGVQWANPIINFKSQTVMNNYEMMVIFTPVLSEDEFKAAQKRYTDLLAANGGEVVHSNPWGLKSLAYPIEKKTTGIYWVIEYKAASDFNAKLNVQLHRDEQVLRHMYTALDKYAVEYNYKKKNGVPTGNLKAEA